MARLLLPPRSKLETVVSFPRQALAAARVYRRTPVRLRRPEPAMRLGLGVATVWFAMLFVSLALLAHRSAAPVGATVGYAFAALLGPIGLALFLTRRPRLGVGLVGAMLVLGQIVAVATLLAT